MADDLVHAFKQRHDQIAAALDGVSAPALAAVKQDIIALFKQVDGAIGELTALKDEIRKLVDRYKESSARPAPRAGSLLERTWPCF